MIKIPNFYASSPLHNEIDEKAKDSLRTVYPKIWTLQLKITIKKIEVNL